ncbi:MAG: TlpA disulfide reductase family protein [Oligoflexia bacterium]|nr:TlpA disulfide reductase family protein [Oligoflexia bacterium]
MIRIFLYLNALVLAGGLAYGSIDLGKPAPGFAGTELNGKKFDLAEQRGNVVLLGFFATWCDGCSAELPILENIYTRHRAEGLEALIVSVDRPRERNHVIEFLKPYDLPSALISDAKVNGFGTPGTLPILYVIDRSGIVRAELAAPGPADLRAKIESLVLPLLKR